MLPYEAVNASFGYSNPYGSPVFSPINCCDTYLLASTEFYYDIYLQGFQIYAATSGPIQLQVNIKIIFYSLSINFSY